MNHSASHLRQMQRILSLGYELVANPLLPDVLRRIVQAVVSLTESENAALYLWDDATATWELAATAVATKDVMPLTELLNSAWAEACGDAAPLSTTEPGLDAQSVSEQADSLKNSIPALLIAPLKFDSRKIGALTATNPSHRPFDAQDKTVLTLFAEQAALAIENARALEHYKQLAHAEASERQMAEALSAASAALTSTLDYDQVIDQILAQIKQVIPCNACNVMIIEDEAIARVFRGHGYAEFGTAETLGEITLHVEQVAGLRHMRESLQAVVVPDVALDPTWVYSRPEHQWIRSYVGVPIVMHEQVIGFLNAMSATPNLYNEMHAERLKSFAYHAATALENARLYRQAQTEIAERIKVEAELRRHRDHLEELVKERTAEIQRLAITDTLTDLFNRRHLLTIGGQALAQAVRYHHPLAVLLIDLDHFKQINDTYGHAGGDEALRQVAAQMRHTTRAADILGRYGGEEFIVVMPETTIEAARECAERLLSNVRALRIDVGHTQIGVTASIGVAALNHAQPQTVDALIALADQAMYVAKQSGRNRVVMQSV